MAGKSRAERQAEEAARAANQARQNLEEQTKILKQRSEREARKAQRILMRSSRAAGGGYFSTDAPKPAADSLGGSGVLG